MTLHTFTFSFFFFNDTATTEIYTLSLHDALPIFVEVDALGAATAVKPVEAAGWPTDERIVRYQLADRKSTRLNSSHGYISYAVFCLKKKKDNQPINSRALPLPTKSLSESLAQPRL